MYAMRMTVNVHGYQALAHHANRFGADVQILDQRPGNYTVEVTGDRGALDEVRKGGHHQGIIDWPTLRDDC